MASPPAISFLSTRPDTAPHDPTHPGYTGEDGNLLNKLETLEAPNAPLSAAQLAARIPARRKQDSLVESLRAWLIDHQTGLAVDLLLLIALSYALFPALRPWTSCFFKLQYFDQDHQLYTRGINDFYFIATWVVIFTGLRAAFINNVAIPAAQRAGVEGKKPKIRFAEQAWLCLYYSVSWAFGMYIWMNSVYWFNFANLWADFPILRITALDKFYYLVQFGFWFQQILVINIEERRKDHWQMFVHHIVTCTLLATSYGYYQTRTGNVVLSIMDIADIGLGIAKMLNYSKVQLACDIAFGVFILTWIVSRHVIYLFVCRSIYADVPNVMTEGIYSKITGELLSTDISQISYAPLDLAKNVFSPFVSGDTVWYTLDMRFVYLTMLLFLQAILVLWMAMILKVAYNVIRGYGADDSRSEVDSEAELIEEVGEHPSTAVDVNVSTAAFADEKIQPKPLEQEVGVEGLNLKKRAGAKKHKEAKTTSSGFSVTGRGAQKELLGRIGCDKPA